MLETQTPAHEWSDGCFLERKDRRTEICGQDPSNALQSGLGLGIHTKAALITIDCERLLSACPAGDQARCQALCVHYRLMSKAVE